MSVMQAYRSPYVSERMLVRRLRLCAYMHKLVVTLRWIELGFSVGRRHHETLYVKRCWIKGGSQEGCGACNGDGDDVAAARNPG